MNQARKMYLGFSLAYAAFVLVPMADTLPIQRQLSKSFRNMLRTQLNFVNLKEYEPLEKTTTWWILPLMLVIMLGLHMMIHLAEARFATAMNGLLSCIVIGVVLRQSKSYDTLILLGRIGFLWQLSNILGRQIDSTEFDRVLLVRATITRAMSCLAFVERLDESLIQMVSLTWVFSLNQSVIGPAHFLPVRVWFFFIVPIYVLGLREWICAKMVVPIRTFKPAPQLIVALLLPLTFLLLPPLATGPLDTLKSRVSLVVGGVNFLLATAMIFVGTKIDESMMRAYLQEERKREGISAEELKADPLKVDIEAETRSVASNLRLILTLASGSTLIGGFLAPNFGLNQPMVVTLSCLIGLAGGVVFHGWPSWKDSRSLLMTHLVTLLVLYRGALQTPLNGAHIACLAFLLGGRMMSLVDKRTFSKIQLESGLCFGLATLVVHGDYELTSLIGIFSAISFVLSLLVTMAREQPWNLIRRESDSYAFLSHALKQKFCAVGSVIEHLCEKLEGTDELDKTTISLLTKVLRESRKGHDTCHAVNLIRNVRSQRFQLGAKAISKKMLKLEVDSWCERGVLDPSRVRFRGSDLAKIELNLQWEVLKAFVIHFACRCAVINFEYQGDRILVLVTSHHGLSHDDRLNIGAVAKTLGGTSRFDGFVLPACFAPSCDEPARARPLPGLIPKGLVFAVLDDNALVRMMVKRALDICLGASPQSIYRGATEEECITFAEEAVKLRPDVIVIDEHLVGDLRGTEIAKNLREHGYTGCILQHSASMLSPDKPISHYFDGVVEKTSSKDELAEDIAKGWKLFQSRHKKEHRPRDLLASQTKLRSLQVQACSPDPE